MKHFRFNISPFRKRNGSGGFTLLEIMVASSVSVIVMAGILSLWYLTARSTYDLYGPTHARSWRQRSINQIRLRLCDASIDSYVISDNGHRIRYTDPTLPGSPTSEFYFTTSTASTKGILLYDEDIHSEPPARRVAEGPISILFKAGYPDPNNPAQQIVDPAMVTLFVKTAETISYGDVDERDGETVVYLRNP